MERRPRQILEGHTLTKEHTRQANLEAACLTSPNHRTLTLPNDDNDDDDDDDDAADDDDEDDDGDDDDGDGDGDYDDGDDDDGDDDYYPQHT